MKDRFGNEIEVGDTIVYGRYGGEVVRAVVTKTGVGKHRWHYDKTQETVSVEYTKYPGTTFEYTSRVTLRTPSHIMVIEKKEVSSL